MVAGVARSIEQEDPWTGLDGFRQPVDDIEPAALGDIGDGLDQHARMLVGRPGFGAVPAHRQDRPLERYLTASCAFSQAAL